MGRDRGFNGTLGSGSYQLPSSKNDPAIALLRPRVSKMLSAHLMRRAADAGVIYIVLKESIHG